MTPDYEYVAKINNSFEYRSGDLSVDEANDELKHLILERALKHVLYLQRENLLNKKSTITITPELHRWDFYYKIKIEYDEYTI